MISLIELREITKKLTVLYVEDEIELITQIKAIFSELFKKVETAENGQVGLEAFKEKITQGKKPYDLVITDINTPLMSGTEMIKEIYKIIPDQAIIVTSAHHDAQYLIPLLNIGISSFLLKPLTIESMSKSLYTTAKSIINEHLLQEQYKDLKKLNKELQEKNIAIEQSLRIIEGMHYKEQLHTNSHIEISNQFRTKKEKVQIKKVQVISKEAQSLINIEYIICNISMKYHLNGIENELLIQLSQEIIVYVDGLSTKEEYKNLKKALKLLADTVSVRPECTKEKELSRIFSILESFFFIYTRWQNKWSTLNDKKFKLSSHSIEHEIQTIIALWKCKL